MRARQPKAASGQRQGCAKWVLALVAVGLAGCAPASPGQAQSSVPKPGASGSVSAAPTFDTGKVRLVFQAEPYPGETRTSSDLVALTSETLKQRLLPAPGATAAVKVRDDQLIEVQAPPNLDPDALTQRLIRGGRMSIHLVEEMAMAVDAAGPLQQVLTGPDGKQLVVTAKPAIAGDLVRVAETTWDDRGTPSISIQFTDEGGRALSALTQANIGRQIAVVVDDRLLMAPVIHSEIADGRAMISGNFTVSEAETIASALSSPLPARLVPVEVSVLGSDAPSAP